MPAVASGRKGQRLAAVALGSAAIFPGVHFLGDDVGFFADAAREQFRRFENRRTNFLEVVGAEDIAHDRLDKVPQRRIRRQQVSRSSYGFNHVPLFTSVILSAASSNELAQSKDPYQLVSTCGSAGRSPKRPFDRDSVLDYRDPSTTSALRALRRERQTPLRMTILN